MTVPGPDPLGDGVGGIGGPLVEYVLMEPDRLKAKLAMAIALAPSRSTEELLARIGDAIRYTFAFETAAYTERTKETIERLKGKSYELDRLENFWVSPVSYKGINSQWRDPESSMLSGPAGEEPDGLMRRRATPEGRVDEALRRDMRWEHDWALMKWEMGELMFDLVEISADEADEVIERFRETWGAA